MIAKQRECRKKKMQCIISFPVPTTSGNEGFLLWPLSTQLKVFTFALGTNSDIVSPTEIKVLSCLTSSERLGPTCECAVQLAYFFMQHKYNPSLQRLVLPVLLTYNAWEVKVSSSTSVLHNLKDFLGL